MVNNYETAITSHFYSFFIIITIIIFLSFEKDPTDNAAKQRESQDCSQKVRRCESLDLRNRHKFYSINIHLVSK